MSSVSLDYEHAASLLIGDVADRFYSKIKCGGGRCHVWSSTTTANGYGRFRIHGKYYMAHRLAFVAQRGDPGIDKDLDHICKNPACCNPAHLEPVSRRDNILRGDNHVAKQAAQTRCKRGHPLSGKNLAIWSGRRVCRECHKTKLRKYRDLKRRGLL